MACSSDKMLSYKSTGPGDKPQARALAAQAEHGGVICASDHGKAKQFWLANDHDAMYNDIFRRAAKERTFYETLQPHLPCKVFYDLELDCGNDDGDERTRGQRMDAMQEAVLATTLAALTERHGVSVPRCDVIVLTSDGPDKASRHLIVPVYFAGVEHVKAFVHDCVLPCHKPWVKHGIDPGVYTKNRQFRLLGCRKLGSPRVLVVGGEGEARTPGHRLVFLSTLLCVPPPMGTVPIQCDVVQRKPKKRGGGAARTPHAQRRRTLGGPAAPRADVVGIQAFLTALIQEHEDAYVASTDVRDNGSISFTCRRTAHTQPCRFGGTHTSNHMALVVYPDTGKIVYSCFGSVGHHPRRPDGSVPEKGDYMTLPETLPLNLRTADTTNCAALALVEELVNQAERGDVGFAEVYTAHFGRENLMVTSTAGSGYMWDDKKKVWREAPSNLIVNSIQRVLMELYTSAKKTLSDSRDGEGGASPPKPLLQAIRTIGRHCNLKGVLHQLCDLLYNPTFEAKLNAEPYELPLHGGSVIDFKTLAVRQRTQSDLWSWESDATYLGPDADCSVALDVVRVVADVIDHPERVGYDKCIQAVLGSLLCADQGAKALPQFHGTSGNNMKSELIGILKTCVPATFTSVDDSVLTGTKQSTGGPDPLLVALHGKRVAVMGDSGKSVVLNTANVKRITGGDDFAARRCHENGGDMHCVCKPVVCTNHAIPFDVSDSAMVERVGNHYYPFTHRFVKNKEGNAKCAAYKTTHLDHFFTAFIRGAHMYAVAGEAVTCIWLDEARGDYMQSINPVGSFLDEDCVRARDAEWGGARQGKVAEYAKTLYGGHAGETAGSGYVVWCDRNGIRPMSQKAFGEKMTVIFGKTKSTKLVKGDTKARAYLGVRLKTEAEKVLDQESMESLLG